MRKFAAGIVAGILIGAPAAAFGWIDPPGHYSVADESPQGYDVTEPLRVVRVYIADEDRWVTEVWPRRCTVFEDGSADCPSY